jgi:hypothetical protein
MPAQWVRLVAALLLAVGLAACGPAATSGPGATASGSVTTSPVEGVITNVVSAGLDQVTEFTLRTGDGTLLRFRIGDLENGAEFPPGHLTEHQATSDPIRVTFRVEGDELIATRLEDAGG